MADPRAAAVDEAVSAAPSRPKQGQPGGAGSSSSALPAAPSAPSSARIRPGLELPGDASRLGSGGGSLSFYLSVLLTGERERADGWAQFLKGQRRPFMCCGVLETKIKEWSVLCIISKSGVCCAQNHHLGMCHIPISQYFLT